MEPAVLSKKKKLSNASKIIVVKIVCIIFLIYIIYLFISYTVIQCLRSKIVNVRRAYPLDPFGTRRFGIFIRMNRKIKQTNVRFRRPIVGNWVHLRLTFNTYGTKRYIN